MINIVKIAKDFVQSLSAWLGVSVKQSNAAYCDIQTADSDTVLVAHDGSLISIVMVDGVKTIVGKEEFDHIQNGLQQSLQTIMSHTGHSIQVFFSHDTETIKDQLEEVLRPSQETANRIGLNLDDLFNERTRHLAKYCATEKMYLVIWTRVDSLTSEQNKRQRKEKSRFIAKNAIPAFMQTQNIMAAVPDLRDSHDSFVTSFCEDMNTYGLVVKLLDVHSSISIMRSIADPEFSDPGWRPCLPGDEFKVKALKKPRGDMADLLWPSLSKQILPRDGEVYNLRTARVGDRIYSTVYIDLFPKDIQPFSRLLSRVLQAHIPWRISFLFDSDGLSYAGMRSALSSVLAITSSQNRLISDSLKLLKYIKLNTDNAVVKLRVSASTWAPDGDLRLLRTRTSMLAKALEGWGSCDVSEISGDPYEGAISTMLAVSGKSPATASIAPLSEVLYMLPMFRPSSVWETGAVLLRSPDGKPLPYQPGSSLQSTWIDLFYARPGSGKSVLSNAINLAVCMSPGLQRLPRIAIIDIGPSSSGLIHLLKDALPVDKKNQVAYHRLQMNTRYAINPFDTQLGCRVPTAQERSFLVNFISLLSTPVSSNSPYDGVAEMAGMVVDELYKLFSDENNPHVYAQGVEEVVDGVLEEIGFVVDAQTTWWEVTDALFLAGFDGQAMLAQRHAMPVLADVAAICRLPAIQDLYGKITVPTGEELIQAFSRMISSAVREYPIISQVTRFDLGEARVVALDLDEVAKSGGDAADRQTAVMYMLARYVLARHYYLNESNVEEMAESYRSYHMARIKEIREDPKRIVFDEFHRTAKADAVRDQVIVDMREGRKWKVQIALLSQSLDDFSDVMIEFATSIFIMEAGPEQAVQRTADVFGLSRTAKMALRNRVHGPRKEGATFLAQFSTQYGTQTQLLTSTLGPIELWSLNTSADDVNLRNRLYARLGAVDARRTLARRFPDGSARKVIEEMLANYREELGFIDEETNTSVIDTLINELVESHNQGSKT